MDDPILLDANERLLRTREALASVQEASLRPLAAIMPPFQTPKRPEPHPPPLRAVEPPRRASLLSWLPTPFRELSLLDASLGPFVAGGLRRLDAIRAAFSEAETKAARARLGHVVIVGPAGAGKTAVASAWLGDRIREGAMRAWFVPTVEIDEMRVSSAAKLTPWSEYAERADRLVLDDMGAELAGAPAAGGIAAQRIETTGLVLARRHRAGLSHVVTTPHDRDALGRIYGDGIARRVYQGAAVIQLR